MEPGNGGPSLPSHGPADAAVSLTDERALRHHWVFAMPVETVLAAVDERVDHHSSKRDELLEKRGEAETLPPQHEGLDEKIEARQEKIREFARWRRMLEERRGQPLPLTISDVEYFGL